MPNYVVTIKWPKGVKWMHYLINRPTREEAILECGRYWHADIGTDGQFMSCEEDVPCATTKA